MTSKLVVNTIESDTGISSVSFASSISMNSTAKFHFSAAGIDIGADTNINRPEAGVLGFNINGEKVRINSDGQLLVGTTTTPSNSNSKLRVHFDQNTSSGSAIEMSHSTNGADKAGAALGLAIANGGASTNAADLYFSTATNGSLVERFRIASTGQVLIGTTTPSGYSSRLLTVAAADGDSSIELRTATDHAGQISFTDGSAGDATNYRGYIQYDHNGDYMRFGTSSTERIRIDSIGRLLINRTSTYASSSERLSINGMTSMQGSSTTTPPLYIFNTDTTGSGTIQPFFYLHDGSGIRGGLGLQYSTGNFIINGQSAIQFRTGATGVGGSEKLRITSGGQVNIGSDLTQTNRTVSIASNNVGQLELKGTEADLWLHSTGPNGVWRILGSTGTNTHRFRIYDNTNTADRFNIDSNGYIYEPAMPFGVLHGTTGWQYNSNGNGHYLLGNTNSSSGGGNGSDKQLNLGWTTSGGNGATNNNFVPSNGIWTAPIAGYYVFGLKLYGLMNSNDYIQIKPCLNGTHLSETIYGYQQGNGMYMEGINETVRYYMEANDTFSWNAYGSNNAWRIYGAHCETSGYLVRGA